MRIKLLIKEIKEEEEKVFREELIELLEKNGWAILVKRDVDGLAYYIEK